MHATRFAHLLYIWERLILSNSIAMHRASLRLHYYCLHLFKKIYKAF